MDITTISDLHGYYPELPALDLLIVAGDFTARDEVGQITEFMSWVSMQNYDKKILVAGNHDNSLMKEWEWIKEYPGVEYLCDSGTQLEYEEPIRCLFGSEEPKLLTYRKTLKIWGSPWTTRFPGMNPKCMAFTVDTDEELAEKWALIPDDIDILITHSPPYGLFDQVEHITKGKKKLSSVGSRSLRNHVLNRIKPRLHVFGHIHEFGGRMIDTSTTIFINGSYVDELYSPVNKPISLVL